MENLINKYKEKKKFTYFYYYFYSLYCVIYASFSSLNFDLLFLMLKNELKIIVVGDEYNKLMYDINLIDEKIKFNNYVRDTKLNYIFYSPEL